MCIRIDMNIFCDPYLHVTCLTKKRSQRALCTALITRVMHSDFAPTMGYSSSLINWGRSYSTMSYSCTSHYLDLGRHTLVVSPDLKPKSVRFFKLRSSTFTFSNSQLYDLSIPTVQRSRLTLFDSCLVLIISFCYFRYFMHYFSFFC